MYSRENYHDCHYHEVRVGGQYAESVKYLKRHGSGRRLLLDFGCGNGSFIIAASNEGFECAGVEFEPSAIANAREKSGLPVTSLEAALCSDRRFEVVHLGDVLEHLPDPLGTIRTLHSLLVPDGLFFIEGPLENHRSLVFLVARGQKAIRRAMGDRAVGATAPTHLFRVNARNQKSFFTDRLALDCVAFDIYETGWPYLATWRSQKSPATFLKAAIAFVAISLSNICRLGQSRIFGNRFRALFKTGNAAVEP